MEVLFNGDAPVISFTQEAYDKIDYISKNTSTTFLAFMMGTVTHEGVSYIVNVEDVEIPVQISSTGALACHIENLPQEVRERYIVGVAYVYNGTMTKAIDSMSDILDIDRTKIVNATQSLGIYFVMVIDKGNVAFNVLYDRSRGLEFIGVEGVCSSEVSQEFIDELEGNLKKITPVFKKEGVVIVTEITTTKPKVKELVGVEGRKL